LNKTIAIVTILAIVGLLGIGFAKITEATPVSVETQDTLDDATACRTVWNTNVANEMVGTVGGLRMQLDQVGRSEYGGTYIATYSIYNRRNQQVAQLSVNEGLTYRLLFQEKHYFIHVLRINSENGEPHDAEVLYTYCR
jgi:hypothetical protein